MSFALVAEIRDRRSYQLHVLSWRLAFAAAALAALTQVLRANHLIGHLASVVVVVPLVAVFCGSVCLVLVTGAIQAAHFSAQPLGRGTVQRQIRFSRMLLVDLVTLPLNPYGRRK
ncbi:hypothetical protein [Micromonospora sp. NBRC 107095]|uniref:hypothetical protein n=1 Tax=Micromonospora sp. NBRC 107095 TaxID=3032209 RepID=UPI0024A3527C|nr:hypothetical protein [Micromonospora sp. NBRC 107095]GLZ58672.1 hypothetical protein Misp05_22480 [Micromonospora sp. NBRC 107095]